MNNPKVSIIIPTYNYGIYLGDAIESALALDYTPVDVIVVDDGSTDSTREVVAKYSDVTYIYQENAGASSARNRGAEDATGEFIVFLDADDYMDKTMVTYLLPSIENDPSVAIVACRSKLIADDGSTLPSSSRNDKFIGELSYRHFLMSNRFPTGGALIRRSAFIACGGFDESLVSTEDRDMWLRLAEKNRVLLMPERLLTVRLHPGSLSSHAARAAEHMDLFITKSRQSTAGKQQSSSFWHAVQSYRDCQIAWVANSEGHACHAISLMLGSLLKCPLFPRQYVSEPIFFRLRALRIFLWGVLKK